MLKGMNSPPSHEATSGRVRRRPGGRAARVVQTVTEATLILIAEKGIAEVSVADIADASGVHETTIYRRWGTRENLLVETLLGYSELTIPIPDTGSLRGDLQVLIAAVIEYLGTARGRALSQAMATGVGDLRWSQLRREFWRARFERSRPIVGRAIDRGELPPDTDARLLLSALIAPLQFLVLLIGDSPDPVLGTELIDLVLDGALPRSTSTPTRQSPDTEHTS
jgi:AcrR family transcriptional regulator